MGHESSRELPVEIIESEILPRLPPKSVGWFRSVSQQWRFFLSTQEFQKMHLCHQNNHTKLFLTDWGSSCIHLIDSSDPEAASTTISSTQFRARPSDLLILASLDGLVCVCLKKSCMLVLWNPLTSAFNMLPTSKSQGFFAIGLDVLGIYSHNSSNDNRILHVKHRRDTIGAYVFSRATNSWRKIQFLKKHQHIRTYSWSSLTFSGTCLYFIAREWCMDGQSLIIAFVVSTERFKEIPFPPIGSGHASWEANLVDIQNRIRLFVIGQDMFGRNWELSLWKMESKRWIKMLVFSGIHNLPLSWIPEYVMNIGEKLIVWDGNRDVYQVDPKTNKYVYVHHGGGSWCYRLERTIYVESVVSPTI